LKELFKLRTMVHWHGINRCATLTHTVGTANIEPKLVDQQTVKKKLLHPRIRFQKNHGFP
jgi:hypothetical protein